MLKYYRSSVAAAIFVAGLAAPAAAQPGKNDFVLILVTGNAVACTQWGFSGNASMYMAAPQNNQPVVPFVKVVENVSIDRLEATILEVLSFDPKGAAISASIGNFKLTAEDDGRPMRIDPQVNTIIRQIPPLFIIDGTNKIRIRSDRNLNPKMNPIVAAEVKAAYQELCNSLEAVTIPLPNRDIQPREPWMTEVPMMLRPGKNPVIVDLALTCTRGRSHTQANEAVVTSRATSRRDQNANRSI